MPAAVSAGVCGCVGDCAMPRAETDMAETTHVVWVTLSLTAEPRRLVNLAFLTPRSAHVCKGRS